MIFWSSINLIARIYRKHMNYSLLLWVWWELPASRQFQLKSSASSGSISLFFFNIREWKQSIGLQSLSFPSSISIEQYFFLVFSRQHLRGNCCQGNCCPSLRGFRWSDLQKNRQTNQLPGRDFNHGRHCSSYADSSEAGAGRFGAQWNVIEFDKWMQVPTEGKALKSIIVDCIQRLV